MNRLKPKKKIVEFLLLVTIYSYVKSSGVPSSADDLMLMKDQFAPTLTDIDTLRTWLWRHKGRVIRRVGGHRTYRYELNKQGVNRIKFLMFPFLKTAILLKKLGVPVGFDMIELCHILEDFAVTFEERLKLADLLLEFRTTIPIGF